MINRRLAPLAALLLALLIPAPALTQDLSFEAFVERPFGDRITLHHQAMAYLEHVAEHSDRVALFQAGESVEQRPQRYVVVTSPANHQRLDDIRDNARRLNDPRTLDPQEAEAIIEDQPAIFYFGGSIHGFELSGSEAALKLLDRLVTEDSAEVSEVLDQLVVIIDPMLNPDGRDAFAGFNHRRVGQHVNASNEDWNNDFNAWQARQYRTSHYFFDLNRDWFAHTHPETRGRVPLIRDWRPQAGVDAHEMGTEAEFYFDPPAEPFGPYFPDYTRNWFLEYGQRHAEAFDRAGYEYMSGERYNFFYPAYTTSFLTYQGAVGMLYEQGSTRGLATTRPDGSVRTLTDALMQQFTAGWASLQMTAERREELLRDYYRAHQEAIADGRGGYQRYLITEEGDPNMVAEVINMLMRNGIEVHRLTDPASLRSTRDRYGDQVGIRDFEAGTYVIEAAQPRNRFLRTLLEPDLPLPAEFLETARARVDRDENPRFYDITAWSVPLLYNVQGYSSQDGESLSLEPVDGPVRQQISFPDQRAGYAYLIDGSQTSGLSAALHMRSEGYRIASLYEETQINGQPFSAGTLILRVGQNPDSLHQRMREMAETYRLDVTPVATGYADPGYPSLGSGDAKFLLESDIAIVAGHPVDAYSFGWAWHTLDYAYDIPVTVLENSSLADMPLDRFTAIVLPDLMDAGAFAESIGEDGVSRLARWVRDGGTLVTIGDAVDILREEPELVALGSFYEREGNEEAQQFHVPGAFFAGELNPAYWLTSGYTGTLPVLVNSSNLYFAPEDKAPSSQRRLAVSLAEDDALIAGHAWPESVERLQGAAFAYEQREGDGRIISFAEDVNFRGYWRGADRLFLNAVILGPTAP